MSNDNFRLARYEELLDHLEALSESANPDPTKVAVTGLQAMINDQLAFIRNQLETGALPAERAQEGMRLLESSFVYGYLVGAGSYVGAVVGEEPGGTASIDAMRHAFAEMYMKNGERNWNASQSVPDGDPEFEDGFESGGEDLRRFLSRLQGEDLGSSDSIAQFIHSHLLPPGNEASSEKATSTGNPRDADAPGGAIQPPDDEGEMSELLSTVGNLEELASLGSEELGRLIFSAAVLYGNNGHPRLRKILDDLYPIYRDKEEEPSRFHGFYRKAADAVERGTTGHEALRVFLVHDDSPLLVCTAALDFAVFHPLQNDDPMTGPKAVLQMFSEDNVECRAGLFRGLLLLGDDRVSELLRDARSDLTDLETRVVCGDGSGYLFASTIEFLIDWLEETEAAYEESKYGLVAAALGNQPRSAMFPIVVTGRRRFPVKPHAEILEDGYEKVPLEDFAQTIEPRLRAIADREPPPQVMPLVLGAWGLEP